MHAQNATFDGFLVIVIVTAVAVGVGFRFHTAVMSSIGGMGMALLFGQVLFWVFAAIGFGTADPETAVAVTTPFMLLVFVPSALIPVSTLPGWLRPIARNQPVSLFIDAVRCLTQGAPRPSGCSVTRPATSSLRR